MLIFILPEQGSVLLGLVNLWMKLTLVAIAKIIDGMTICVFVLSL